MQHVYRAVTELARAYLARFLASAGPRLQTNGQFGPTADEIARTLEFVPEGAARADSAHDARIEAATDALREVLRTDHLAPLSQLFRVYGLFDLDLTLIALLFAPEIDHELERAYTYALNDFTRKRPDIGFLARLIGGSDQERIAEVMTRFDDAEPLRRHGIVTLPAGDVALAMRTVRLVDRVVAFLRGQETIDELARTCARVTMSPPIRSDLVMRPELVAQLERALDPEFGPPRVLLAGPEGSGRAMAVEMLASERAKQTVRIDLQTIAAEGRIEERLAAALREAALREAYAVLDGGNAIDQDTPRPLARAIVDAIGGLEIPIVFTLRGHPSWLLEAVPNLVELDVPAPNLRERIELWRRSIPEGLASDEDLETVAGRYGFTGGTIARTARRAASAAKLRDPAAPVVTLDDLGEAARRMFSHRLGGMAQRIPTGFTWNDLVLPEDTATAVKEIVRFARRRSFLLEEWGFAAKLPYGRGVSAILAGPPGTGKTMVAQLLAHELGYDLFRVDLSQVVNKYIGETEKNLAKIFDEAESSHAVLFFDEADSLFAKRTEVKSSNDRYANLEVNYLLQRMETYDGVTLLATNLEQGLDEAFKRRVRFSIQFEMPEAPVRARLWRSMFPTETPLADDINWARMGDRWEMAGGHIKKAALRAAARALARGKDAVITGADLEAAAQFE
ncbi:MAG TPA: ATP-binding protein, partial [Kofleriaceae bacterium]|nr:ATP-binding protein [Kofleriaceae bacterium]